LPLPPVGLPTAAKPSISNNTGYTVTDPQTVISWLRQRVTTREFQEFLAELLLDLCRVDTIPTGNIVDTTRREDELITRIEKALLRFGPKGTLERRPLPDSIAGHPFYTFPHYAGRADVYSGRSNLVYLRDAPAASTAEATSAVGGIMVNAHIDTVAPFFTPQREGNRILGRGACDDKGGCAIMVACLRLLQEFEQRFDVILNSDLTLMFVIDEEMGGNGSLALALDQQLGHRYSTVVVLECCDGQVHPGGRGAVWYRVEIPCFDVDPPESLAGYNPIELALEIIRCMDREGAVIQRESDHSMFSPTAVQTSPGILGPFGEHPARICASVRFLLKAEIAGTGSESLRALLDSGLREYIRRYGDKTAAREPGRAGSTAALERHYELRSTPAADFQLQVYGLSGHMGALYENDNALIKAAYLLEPVKRVVENRTDSWSISLSEHSQRSTLVLEGGQGFLPTHSMEQIKARLNRAVQSAYRGYARSTWKRVPFFRDAVPRVSFSKLHNEAFQSDPDSPAVVEALAAAEEAGIAVLRPPLGWEVSSDARIFAHLRPDCTVFTTGPGQLARAHSDQEQITVEELCSGTLMLTLFLLRCGGLCELAAGSE
jgi:acetylornithine deacetylase/succinyl-diaminopimelate desuccinylase-like protein